MMLRLKINQWTRRNSARLEFWLQSGKNAAYVTIAHQDHLYFSDYSIRAVRKLEESKHPLIYFSDYCEIRNGEKVRNNGLLKTKRMLLSPLKIKRCQKSRFLRRRILYSWKRNLLSFSYVCKREFTKPCISSAFSVQRRLGSMGETIKIKRRFFIRFNNPNGA